MDKILIKMQQIKTLNKIPNDWDYELRKNGISFNLFEPINKLLSFQQGGKEIYPALQDIYKAFELCSFSNTKVVLSLIPI